MNSTRMRAALAVPAAALAALGLCAATNVAGAADHGSHGSERLVVRGDATVADAPCPGGVCLEIKDGSFRGTPVGTGAYTGAVKLEVAKGFANGEGGVCAPIHGKVRLGTGSADRLVLAVAGNSCQDGSGPVTASSFTGLARFKVRYGTGSYAGASGAGLASFSEDAADHDRLTLIGRISR